VGAIFGLFVQFAGSIWWAATITAKVDAIATNTREVATQQNERIKTLEDDMKVVDDKIANIKRDLAVLLDRGGTVRVVGATP
jgi:hypothetical protein